MTRTPRTDAEEELIGGLWFVLADLPRQFERERASLLLALHQIIDGDPAGGTYSGSQCVAIAQNAIDSVTGGGT